jgi:hypothetical protein
MKNVEHIFWGVKNEKWSEFAEMARNLIKHVFSKKFEI